MQCVKTFHWPGVVSGWLAVTLAGGLSPSRVCAQDDTFRDQVETPLDDLRQADGQISDATEADSVEPLERGPIHEAFAEPVVLDTEETIVVLKAPPETIDELPPAVTPDGLNVIWVPGYWHWLDDEADFVWVSGLWRNVPPNQQWIPGYWTTVEGGHRWTPGFWTAADELSYLPEPPQSLEAGPTSPAPGESSFWVPGCWEWQTTDYSWRPGYWSVGYDNWLWVPSRCVYTPRGYVFLNGYWDYPFQRRGLLFAPVRYRRPLYRRSGYVFTPRQWINVNLLTRGLFVSPRYRHYYFGNYYGAGYASRGFYPWFGYHNRRFGYDPLFAYTSWQRGQSNRGWLNDLQNEYRRLDDRGGRDSLPGNDIVDRGDQREPFGNGRPNEERRTGQDGPPNGNGRADRDQPVVDQNARRHQGDQDRDGRPQFVRQMDELAVRSRDQGTRGENSDNRVADIQISDVSRLSENERQRVRERTTNELSDLRRRREQSESQLRASLDRSNVDSIRNSPPLQIQNENGRTNVGNVQRETLRPVQGSGERGESARQSRGSFQLPQRASTNQPHQIEQPRLRGGSANAPTQGGESTIRQRAQSPAAVNRPQPGGQLQAPQQRGQVNVPPRPQGPAGANRAQPRGQIQQPQQRGQSIAPSNRGGGSPAFSGQGGGNRGGGGGNRSGGSGNGGRGGGGGRNR